MLVKMGDFCQFVQSWWISYMHTSFLLEWWIYVWISGQTWSQLYRLSPKSILSHIKRKCHKILHYFPCRYCQEEIEHKTDGSLLDSSSLFIYSCQSKLYIYIYIYIYIYNTSWRCRFSCRHILWKMTDKDLELSFFIILFLFASEMSQIRMMAG